MLRQTIPVLLQISAALAIALGAIITGWIIGKKAKRSAAKDTPYECGKPPMGKSPVRFSVKFHLIAILFILFDIEIIFIYPWAVSYLNNLNSTAGHSIFWSMLAFIAIVELGHLYAYKKGVFNWNR